MFTIKVKSIGNDGRIYYTDALTVIDEPYETAEEAREVIAEWEELDRRAGEYMPDRYQVEEIPAEAPAAYVTKDDERKALKKIVKIIEKLGPDSYVAAAFEGVEALALENIADDAAYSFPGRIRGLERLTEEIREECTAEKNRREEAGHLKAVAEAERDAWQTRAERAEAEAQAATDAANDWIRARNESEERAQAAEAEAEALRREIVELKAKLYDLIA